MTAQEEGDQDPLLAKVPFRGRRPLAETKKVVGGYIVIEAVNYDEAVSLCRSHPHLREGRIVIRQLA